MLTDDVVQNGEHAKSYRGTGSQVQLTENNCMYFVADFEREPAKSVL